MAHLFVEEIEDALGSSLITFSHVGSPAFYLLAPIEECKLQGKDGGSPLVSKVHAAETQRTDPNAGRRREVAVASQRRMGRRSSR